MPSQPLDSGLGEEEKACALRLQQCLASIRSQFAESDREIAGLQAKVDRLQEQLDAEVKKTTALGKQRDVLKLESAELKRKLKLLQQDNARLFSEQTQAKPSSPPRSHRLSLRLKSNTNLAEKDTTPKDTSVDGVKSNSMRLSRRHSRRMSTAGLSTMHEVAGSFDLERPVREQVADLRDSKLSSGVQKTLFGHSDYISDVAITETPSKTMTLTTVKDGLTSTRVAVIVHDADWYLISTWARLNSIPIGQQ